jgi:hypothetical protein
VRERLTSGMGFNQKTKESLWFICVFLVSGLFPLSLSNLAPIRCCSVYIGLGGLITGGRLTGGHH